MQPDLLYDEMGQGKCLACHLCESACPTDCLYIEEEPAQVQDREKRPRVVEIDLARCLFCGQCVESCPEGAIGLVARNGFSGDLRWNMVRGDSVNS
ncbi:MAG TPA: 4Fe-4S dicluster domain-containing protein [Candidatus Latescibacteria bacterium]|nr:4Fe-4S dicluster domain-containing protein [Candidatus Latescibacterota bacterium]